MTSEERVAKLADPVTHFKYLAQALRDKLEEANVAYKNCLEYGLTADFYIGPNKSYTYLPDSVILTKTVRSKY